MKDWLQTNEKNAVSSGIWNSGCHLGMLPVLTAHLYLFAFAAAAQQQSLRVGSAIQEPHAYQDVSQKPKGFFVDVMTEAGRRAGYQVQWVFRGEGLDDVVSGNFADIYAGGYATPDRKKRFFVTQPWWRDENYIVVQESNPIHHSSDLAARTLLYELRPPLPVPLEKLIPGVKAMPLASRPDRLEAICIGNADAGLFNHIALMQLIQNRPGGCKEVSLRIIPQNEVDVGFSIIAPLARQKEAQDLRQAIETMALDGTLAALARQAKMFPIQGQELTVPGYFARHQFTIWTMVGISLLVIGYWLSQLRNSHLLASANLKKSKNDSIAKDTFLATMSHEIRTPMNAVLGYLDLLQDTPLRLDQQQFANDIRMSTRSLLRTLSDILEFSKMRSDTVHLNLKPGDLTELIDNASRYGALAAEAKHLELIVRLDPAAPRFVVMDEGRLQQIIENLVSNAIKFTSSGYVRVNVALKSPEQIEITVRDTGIGIVEDKLAKIFEPFQQLDSGNTRRYEGVGLGLSIVRQIVTAMHGTIKVESKPGFGTHFHILVPIKQVDENQAWIEDLRDNKNGQVALIADQSENLAVLREYLSCTGNRLVHFHNVKQARAMLNAELSSESGIQKVFIEASLLADSEDSVQWLRTLNSASSPQLILVGTFTAIRLIHPSLRDQFDAILNWPVSPGNLLSLKSSLLPAVIHSPSIELRTSVLVVDDNAINRRISSALLSKLGCIVQTAEDGKIAVDMCRQDSFGIVLMDCQMPNMDGFEATQHIRTLSTGGKQLRIYGTSASTEPETESRCLDSGMNGYLPKPISIKDLEALLAQIQS